MARWKETTELWAAVALLWSAGLCVGSHAAANSPQPAPSAVVASPRPGGEHGGARTLSHALSTREPRLRLTQMENVGQRAAAGASDFGEPISDREQLALSSAANDLLDRLASSGGRQRGVVRTLRAAARIADTPNRALCLLTGADRARLDLLKRRVSLTWFVSW
jgi:hypothetical protein